MGCRNVKVNGKVQNNLKYTPNTFLSHDVAVIQWITSWNKNRMTTRVITLWRVYVTSLTTSVSTMPLHIELNMLILKAIKFRFKGSYDKQNLSLVVISSTRVRFSIY